jgi:hypothetical protein
MNRVNEIIEHKRATLEPWRAWRQSLRKAAPQRDDVRPFAAGLTLLCYGIG